jgi:hypothetical protein
MAGSFLSCLESCLLLCLGCDLWGTLSWWWERVLDLALSPDLLLGGELLGDLQGGGELLGDLLGGGDGLPWLGDLLGGGDGLL